MSSSPPATNNTAGIPQWRVEVWLYDLSMGMARSFSQALLGKQIEGIWHTGVVVYGYEYFYGGGIMASAPGATQAGQPMRKIDMGYTSIDQSTFHEFLRGISDRFTPATYSLLSHNCNNFSHEVCKFLTGSDMPAYITGLPEEALNSPAGAMFRPIILQMEAQFKQNASANGGAGYSGMMPWSVELLNLPPVNMNLRPDRIHTPSSDDRAAIQQAHTVLAQGNHIAGQSTTILAATAPGINGAHPSHPHAALKLSLITASSKPLLSNDPKVASFYALLKVNAKKAPATASLSDSDRALLESLANSLTHNADTTEDIETRSLALFDRLLNEWPVELLFPVLGLYRLLVLKQRVAARIEDDQRIVNRLLSLVPETGDSAYGQSSAAPMAAQAMALCTVANLFNRPSLASKLANHPSLVHSARSALSSPHQSVRVMAATILYNASLSLAKDDSDEIIELVTFLIEYINNETDAETVYRSLLALGHLLYGNSSAAMLVATLEFNVSSVVSKHSSHANVGAISKDIATIVQHEQQQLVA